ncbi:dihydroxyacetone kinase subunit DhaL [Ruminococcus gauvreauii]|uniref:dihydroxyacetone kinase subunit DhaL n=1 Tax=Ruminococcus gauvreauii TaxID=438033 RepID=UPI003983F2E1
MLTVLNEEDARGMIAYIADKIIENKPFLTEIDSKIGDGDHGIGMAGGMQKARDKVLDMKNTGDVYQVFASAGKAMLMSMGGASGVLFGSLFMAGTRNKEAKQELEASDIACMMRHSLDEIKVRGKAEVGDKTMVDALQPAVEAMESACDEGLTAMLEEAEHAAAEGVEKTKQYQARFGRAKSLMERAVGYQDAGATSVWIILRAMREYAQSH